MKPPAIVACFVLGTALLVAPHCGGPHHAAPTTPGSTPDFGSPTPGFGPSSAPATAPAPTAPTTTVPVTPSQLAAVDRTQAAQPVTAYLPHDEARFSIDYKLRADGSPALTVVLKAVLNRPDQRDQWRAQLALDKAAAMEWLRVHKADPQLSITWLPPESATL